MTLPCSSRCGIKPPAARQIYVEAHTVDTDADSNISNDTGSGDLLFGRPAGLNAANFPFGSSRYLDVTQGGVSVLADRLPLYASVFSLTDPGSIAGNLTMANSTATAGNILKDGVRFLHNYGSNNTFLGLNGGNFTMTGGSNTAIGFGAVVNASNKIRLGDVFVTVVEGPPYSTVSDKTKKENFQPVDGEEVLQKIRTLSLTSWNYIGHDPKQFRHYGPVAQEFFAAFGHDGIGTIRTPTTITSTDMAGILMIAIQALEKRTAENAALKARIEALERLVKGTQTAGSEPRR